MTAATSMLAVGCAVTVGGTHGRDTTFGLLHVARSVNSESQVVDRRVFGLDIRVGTAADGVVLGYSRTTSVAPREGAVGQLSAGFRLPFSFSWFDHGENVFHELGWLLTNTPRPGPAALHSDRSVGAGVAAYHRTLTVFAGHRSHVRLAAPIDLDAAYDVTYDSKTPLVARFARSDYTSGQKVGSPIEQVAQ